MHGFDWELVLVDKALLVHQARRVGADDEFGARVEGVLHFLLRHSCGYGFEFNRKSASEAATHIRIFHLYKLQTFHVLKQGTRFVFQAVFAQGSTRIMIRDPVFENRPEVGNVQDIHQEIGDFKNVPLQLFVFVMVGRVVEQLIKILFHIADAGSRRAYHQPAPVKVGDELFAQLFGLVPIAAVKGKLPAAGLLGIVVDGKSRFFQELYHIESCLWEKLVDKTGNKNIYIGYLHHGKIKK